MSASETIASPAIPLYRQAQEWLLPALQPGAAYAVDATCGNGHDTLFLCNALGSDQSVIGFDLQSEAIESTRERLRKHHFHPILLRENHSQLEEALDRNSIGSIQAAIFNLGYLPGGDHSLTTQPPSTLLAIQAILSRATSHFRLSIVAYRGHPGGLEEASQIRNFLRNLPSDRFTFVQKEGQNHETGPIFLGIGPHESNPTN
ncbi:class I SAM-dependent methyltransferase [Puniceicoccus vermicola]|uniref:Class I SAM-dependent methyltransferase n=1 Tax=Puniceicoccus vermicola TaxID=388746 RepID=A0A7X1B100_9BACT|nr:class I SAM-dependent methyltransferase [Puniceicoccus vermicola]MBC2603631.1 class I SAM-dependent methyltransferase [Puniceicoccus vermicola]